MIDKKNMLGVGISDATKEEVLEYAIKNLENFKKKLFFVTPNPEFLVLANKNPMFKNILNRADLASADGIGLIIAAKFLGKDMRGRFTGVDLVESLCEAVSEKPITVGFLGGRGGVAEKTAECLIVEYPTLKVTFVASEWIKEGFDRAKRIMNHESGSMNQGKDKKDHNSSFIIHDSNFIDILFVAFGAPKQEFWISENLDKIPVKIAIGVGGAFDYISGKIPRAPFFVRKLGMEWLFRLLVQPWRIKRQLSLIEFAWLVIKEKLSRN